MQNENKITGNWSKLNGKNKMEFSLISSNSNFETTMNNISNSKNVNISGEYNSLINKGGASYGNVKIKSKNNFKFSFKISVVSSSGNMREIEGIRILSNGIGKYSTKNFGLLTFKVSKEKLIITERNCETNHGMGAYFSGKNIK